MRERFNSETEREEWLRALSALRKMMTERRVPKEMTSEVQRAIDQADSQLSSKIIHLDRVLGQKLRDLYVRATSLK